MKPRVLFVDDEPNVLAAYRRLLRPQHQLWELDFCDCPQIAWEKLCRDHYDTVVTDLQMPGMSGFQLLERILDNPETREIPVVIVTGTGDMHSKARALEIGAMDLLSKPVSAEDLKARLGTVLRLKSCQDQLRSQNESLEQRVRQRTAELHASRMDIVWHLAKAAEFRDEDTGNHILRVGCYSRVVAEALGLGTGYTDDIFLASPLHDLGKISIPDEILRKPGRLTEEEWRIMSTHCQLGADILHQGRSMLLLYRRWGALPVGVASEMFDNPLLVMASEIALAHHEKWDGSGYPKGLSGEDIPLSARIVAICDVFDALRSSRPYKRAYSLEKTLAILEQEKGRHFDPDVYDAFSASLDCILQIGNELSDRQACFEGAISQC